MRYYEEKGKKFIENGPSKVRVEQILTMESPICKNTRVVRVFEVHEILRFSHTNPISRGHHLCLSFPNEQAHAKDYTWYRGGKFEECQVPLEIKDKGPVNKVIYQS